MAEAKAVLSIAGERLMALEIGNEPDLFPNQKHRMPEYGYEDGWRNTAVRRPPCAGSFRVSHWPGRMSLKRPIG